MNTKFKIIEKVIANLAKEYVNNNKTAADFVKECDTDVVDLCNITDINSCQNISELFELQATFRVYRNKQKGVWNLIKKVRLEN